MSTLRVNNIENLNGDPIDSDATWTRNTVDGVLAPTNSTDDVFTEGDVKVGGTSATPNISLNAGGTAVFANPLGGGAEDAGVNIANTGSLFCKRAGSGFNKGVAFAVEYGTTRTTEIFADGTATFADDVQMASQNSGPLAGMRNVIINGLFAIDQRANGGATLANTNIFTRDRWQSIAQGLGNSVTVSRSVVNLSDAPNVDGAADALIYTTTGALSQSASTNLYLSQKIEGRNFRAMSGWVGSTNDRPVTLSFWVKSSVAGTYSISLLRDPTGIGNTNLLTYVANFDADSTWQKRTITIPAPADSGASITSYVELCFHVWGGSSRRAASTGWQNAASAVAVVSPNYNANWGSASGQTFEITAVQLEPGPVATPFEHRPIGTELALCQRYYEVCQAGQYFTSGAGSNAYFGTGFNYSVEKRVVPTVVSVNITNSNIFSPGGVDPNSITTNGGTFITRYQNPNTITWEYRKILADAEL